MNDQAIILNSPTNKTVSNNEEDNFIFRSDDFDDPKNDITNQIAVMDINNQTNYPLIPMLSPTSSSFRKTPHTILNSESIHKINTNVNLLSQENDVILLENPPYPFKYIEKKNTLNESSIRNNEKNQSPEDVNIVESPFTRLSNWPDFCNSNAKIPEISNSDVSDKDYNPVQDAKYGDNFSKLFSSQKNGRREVLDNKKIMRTKVSSPTSLSFKKRDSVSLSGLKEEEPDHKLNNFIFRKNKTMREKFFKKIDTNEQVIFKAQEVLQDKTFVPKKDQIILRNNPSQKYSGYKLTKILRKHMITNDDHSEDGLQLFGVVGKLKKLQMRFLQKLKYHLTSALSHSFNKIMILITESSLTKPLRPNGLFRLSWDVLVTLFIILDMILLPFKISFNDALENHEKNIVIIDGIQTIFFFIDIILNFYTAYYADGNLVFEYKKIFVHYIENWFWMDLLCSFPYDWICDFSDSTNPSQDHLTTFIQILRFFRIIRIIRIIKVQKILRKFQDSVDHTPLINGIISLIKLCLMISLLAHWCGCGWNYIAISAEGSSWLKDDGYNLAGPMDRYIASLYFAVTTMITVGYGDISPVNSSERIYTIFMMILGGGVFGYAMSSIAMILQSLENAKGKKLKMLRAISRYMQKNHLPNDIQQDARKYLEFKLGDENEMSQTEQDAYDLLSKDLKDRITEQINGSLLYKNRLFSTNFSRKLLRHVSSKIEVRTYAPEEVVINNLITDPFLFYVARGNLDMYFHKNTTTCFSIGTGSHFGEYAFFSNLPEIIQVKSVNFSYLLLLKRSDFLEGLQDFPLDREAFCMIKDKLLIYQDYSILQMTCSVCNKSNHTIETCSKLQYIANKEDVIRAYLDNQNKNYSIFQRDYRRRQRLKFHALKILERIKDASLRILDLYPPNILDSYNKNETQKSSIDTALKFGNSQRKIESQNEISSSEPNILMKNVRRLLRSKLYSEKISEDKGSEDFKLYNQTMKVLDTILNEETDIGEGGDHDDHNNTSAVNIKKRFKTDFEFDKIMNFQVYFSHNNLNKIMDRNRSQGRVNSNIFEETKRLKNHLRRFFKAAEKEKNKQKLLKRYSDGSNTSKSKNKDSKFEAIISM